MNQRIAQIRLNHVDLVDIFAGMAHGRILLHKYNIPSDARFVGANYDVHTRALIVTLSSSEWSPVAPLAQIPLLEPESIDKQEWRPDVPQSAEVPVLATYDASATKLKWREAQLKVAEETAEKIASGQHLVDEMEWRRKNQDTTDWFREKMM